MARSVFSGNYIRLSTMMFLEFFVLGATNPVFSLYLKDQLNFSGSQTGSILATSAVSALISPVIGAMIADKLIRAERLLAVIHFCGAAVIYFLSVQTGFIQVLALYLVYWLLIGPSVALTTTITFHHSLNNSNSFGIIRLWGTIGWFAAAWVFSYVVSLNNNPVDSCGNLHWALYLACAASVILGLYSFTLPTGIGKKEKSSNFNLNDSLKIVLKPQILLLAMFSIIITFADRFYMFGAAPFLKTLNFSESKIMPVLSIGQVPEIVGLCFLGFFLSRLGLKKVLLLGIFFEISRFVIFSTGTVGLPLMAGISFHGLTYAFFFIPVTIFLDNCSDRYSRASVHQLFSIITGGIGNLAGNLLAGFAADIFTVSSSDSQINFTHFWIVPLVLSILGLFGISICLRDKKQKVDTGMPEFDKSEKPVFSES